MHTIWTLKKMPVSELFSLWPRKNLLLTENKAGTQLGCDRGNKERGFNALQAMGLVHPVGRKED